jgi:hypothetical protein
MNELVPIVTGFASGLTVNQVAKAAEEFAAAYFGHKGESIATMLGDALRRKKENAGQVIGKAYLTLLNIGVPMKDFNDIPLNLSEPIMEGASQAETEALRARWAYLLANAADPRSLRSILPSFPAILKDLTPNDVIFLDRLYGHQNEQTRSYEYEALWNHNLERLYPHAPDFDLESRRVDDVSQPLQITLDSLGRHLLIEKKLSVLFSSSDMPSNQQGQVIFKYVITALGRLFVEGCRPPEK